jgi:hypothetical protein
MHNFLSIRLQGTTGNLSGFGAKIYLYDKGLVQFLEQSPVRGFCSGVDPILHFGVGNSMNIDSIRIVWPNDYKQVLHDIKADQLITLKEEDAVVMTRFADQGLDNKLFQETTDALDVNFRHKESSYFDFGFQRALPQKYSQLGPPLACGDVNGDGLTDFFVGGAAYQTGKIFIQEANGNFIARDLQTGIKNEEDLGAIFFDADGDKDLDLLVTGGSNEFGTYTAYNHPRLFKNDGRGNFSIDEEAIPADVNEIASVVQVADIDQDGDLDIFIGGRMLPQRYPQSPRSFVLRNDHGKFTDITEMVNKALMRPGMVTGAAFADFNNDGKLTIVICMEWMEIRFLKPGWKIKGGDRSNGFR